MYYLGYSQTFPSGDKLVHGQQGEVVGPSIFESHKGKGVAVLFPGNKGNVNLPLFSVRRLRAAFACAPPAPAPERGQSYSHPSRLMLNARR